MDLANFERRANSGAPVVGARVTLYTASAIDPTTPLATTFTDANGYWSFTGLAQGAYDLLVEAPGSGYKKWYKGQARIGVDQLAVSSGFSPAVGTVPGASLVSNSVTTTQIADGTIQNVDIGNAVIAAAKLLGPGAGSPNTVARTTDGTNVVYGKIAAADVPVNALNASSIFGGGTANRVLRTTDGTNALWGQVGTPDVAPGAASSVLQTNAGSIVGWLTSLLVSGSIQAGGKLYPSNQNYVGLDVPISNVAVASAGLALIGTNGRMGLAVVIDAGTGQTALFQLMGSANQVAMLAGNAAVFDVVNGSAGKINCIYSSSNYYLQNSTAGARPLTCIFAGIGT